eukprot:232838-Pleurochrysis_carterae.AAC.2
MLVRVSTSVWRLPHTTFELRQPRAYLELTFVVCRILPHARAEWHPLRACDPRGQAALQVAARDARGTSRASLPREFGGAARPA